ncbi:hypothetical protein D021_1382A, partial [Vibrio parahaemolyticus 10296]
MESNPASTT